MTKAEQLFLPLYLFLKIVAYVYLFLRLLPAAGLGFLLGYGFRRMAWPRAWRTLEEWGLAPAGIRAALLLWEAIPLALGIYLGGWIGWWITFMKQKQDFGGCVGTVGFLLGHLLAYRQDKKV